MKYDFINGEVLFFNKPLTWTSFDVVNKIRISITKTIKRKIKVGHAGTLDPLATGLLIICFGKKTKQIYKYQDLEKEYIATIKLGATTPSFDLETEINNNFPTEHINLQKIEQALKSFIGKQEQIPPIFSAKKVNGKRAYKNARQGKDVKLKPSIVEIKEIKILNFEPTKKITLKIKCSKGTYIRAIARDLGEKLNSGAHLIELQRTKIGEYDISNAITIKEFEEILNNMQ